MAKIPIFELKRQIDAAMVLVPIGSHWRHYKGPEYTVKSIIIQEDDMQPAVVYAPVLNPDVAFMRPLSAWQELVTFKGTRMMRFVRIV